MCTIPTAIIVGSFSTVLIPCTQLTTMSESSSQFGPSLDRHILSERSTHRTVPLG